MLECRADCRILEQEHGNGPAGEPAGAWFPRASSGCKRGTVSALRAQMLGAGFPPLGDDEVRGVRAPAPLMTGEHSPPIFARHPTDRLEELLPIV